MNNLITNLSSVINKALILPINEKEIKIKSKEFQEISLKLTNDESDIICSKLKKLKWFTNKKKLNLLDYSYHLNKFCKKSNVFAFSVNKVVKNGIFAFFQRGFKEKINFNDAILFYEKENGEIIVFLIVFQSNNYEINLQMGKIFVLFLINTLNLVCSTNYQIDNKNIMALVFDKKTTKNKKPTKKGITFNKVNGLPTSERLYCYYTIKNR